MNWALGPKFLWLTATLILVQCGKGDDGGDGYGPTTEPLVVTVTASNFNTNFDENPAQGASKEQFKRVQIVVLFVFQSFLKVIPELLPLTQTVGKLPFQMLHYSIMKHVCLSPLLCV